MSERNVVAIVGLLAIAVATMLGGCGEPETSSETAPAPVVVEDPGTPADGERAEAHVAYRVSGMKKTASGAT